MARNHKVVCCEESRLKFHIKMCWNYSQEKLDLSTMLCEIYARTSISLRITEHFTGGKFKSVCRKKWRMDEKTFNF